MNTSNLGKPSTTTNTVLDNSTANPATINNFYVPCVPLSVSVNLVAARSLAKQLAASVASFDPKFAKLSLVNFANIQLKKSELRLNVDECAMTDEALLDACVLNIEDLFSEWATYQMMLEHGVQADVDKALERLHAYAMVIGLAVDTYCVNDVIHPDKLFDACLKRVQKLQKRWQDNYFQSIELALQLQRDTVYGAAASCLTEICQHGLDNQITLEPTPQAQEDVLVSLATFVEAPFSGEWPVLRQRIFALGNQGNTGNEGGVQ